MLQAPVEGRASAVDGPAFYANLIQESGQPCPDFAVLPQDPGSEGGGSLSLMTYQYTLKTQPQLRHFNRAAQRHELSYT